MKTNTFNVQQIATTIGQPCGVGVFAQRLHDALVGAGICAITTRDFVLQPGVDAVLVHHEWSIVSSGDLRAFCRRSSIPVILFPHSADATEFRDVVDGFITMNDGIVNPAHLRLLKIRHAASAPAELTPRAVLKERFGFAHARTVIGASGFLTEPRYFANFVRRLLPFAREHSWLICVFAPTHANTEDWMIRDLRLLQEENPQHVFFENAFLTNEELNLRLQACDLLWCWTALPDSSCYASGVSADMYGSGTRVVLSNKQQHSHVLGLPNVVTAPGEFDPFLDVLVAEAMAGRFERHNPHALSWDATAREVADFISTIAGAAATRLPHVRKSCAFLQSRQEIAASRAFIKANGWIHHTDPLKDWDLANVFGELHGDVLDMGCYGSYVVPNALLNGRCGRVAGIDLRTAPPIEGAEIYSGDLTRTRFGAATFDTLTCLSVIEHGVDFKSFATECARLLRPGGKLIVTFDYWEPRIDTGHGRAWEILDKSQILELIAACTSAGLRLESEIDWSLGEPAVHHLGYDYTFGLLRFIADGRAV